MSNVVVLGGGISGLSCAYYLSKLGKHVLNKVTLLEASPNVGGWITSTRFRDGRVYEHGPKSIRVAGIPGYTTLALAEDVGLSHDILSVTSSYEPSKKRFIMVDNKLHALPNSLFQLFRKLSPFSQSFFRVIVKELTTPKLELKDDTVHNFASRRFGNEVANLVFDPMCRGIVANSSKNISVRSLFPNLFKAEQQFGSVIKGMAKSAGPPSLNDLVNSQVVVQAKMNKWAMWSLKHGLGSLPEALADNLARSELIQILTDTKCTNLVLQKGLAKINFGLGETTDVNHVFSTIPAKKLSELICSDQPTMAKQLSSITATSVAVVNLQYRGKAFKEQAFGFLVPSNQDSKILGITFDSCCFPDHDGLDNDITRITCMMGGYWFDEYFGPVDDVSKESLLQDAIEAAATYLKIDAKPTHSHVAVQKNCIPEYKLGHDYLVEEMRNNIRENQLPLTLLGSSYSGVSINECIYNSKIAAQNYIQSLEN